MIESEDDWREKKTNKERVRMIGERKRQIKRERACERKESKS